MLATALNIVGHFWKVWTRKKNKSREGGQEIEGKEEEKVNERMKDRWGEEFNKERWE